MPVSIPTIARRPGFWWSGYAAWFALLFVLSSLSMPGRAVPGITGSDKVAHAVYFAAGTGALYFALRLGPLRNCRAIPLLALCLLSAAAVGAFDEWHQSMTPGRSGNDAGDWLADVVGGLIGFLVGALLYPRLRDRPPCPSRAAG